MSLTAAGVVFAGLTLISGPILARALGPGGRGDLAAILVPIAVAEAVALFGQDILAAREAARGRSVGTLALSLGAVLVGTGLLAFLVGIPVSSLLAEDRAVVQTFLLVGFALVPFTLFGLLLVGICSGLERWNLVIAARLVPISIVVLALVALLAAGSLTVASAAIVYFSLAFTTILVTSPVLRDRRFRFDPAVAKGGIPFAAKAWAGDTADFVNARLDQLLMITFVSASDLGLYVVAASVGRFSLLISGGMAWPLLARVSAGEVELALRAHRTALFLILLLTLVVAAATPFLLSALFGPEFADAAEPAWVLLAAGVPLSGVAILGPTLNGVGRPGLPAVGQALALLIMVPGLFVLLPEMGIMGAALVSVVAYTANFLLLFVATIRICDTTALELLIPNRSDLAWLWGFIRERLAGFR